MNRIFRVFLMLIAVGFVAPQANSWADDPYEAHDEEWFSSQSPESVRLQIGRFYEKFLERKQQEDADENAQAETSETQASQVPRSDTAQRDSFSIARTLSLMKDGLEFNQIIGEQIIVYHQRPELRDAVVLLFQSIQTAVGPELEKDLHVSPMTKFAQGTFYTAMIAYFGLSLARGGGAANAEKFRWYQLGKQFMSFSRRHLANYREILTVTGKASIAGAILAVHEAWRTRKMDPAELLDRAKREVLYKLGQKVALYREFLRQTRDGEIYRTNPGHFAQLLAQIATDTDALVQERRRYRKNHSEFRGDQLVYPDQEDGPKVGLETIQYDLTDVQNRLPDAQMTVKKIQMEALLKATEGRTPPQESLNNSPQEHR